MRANIGSSRGGEKRAAKQSREGIPGKDAQWLLLTRIARFCEDCEVEAIPSEQISRWREEMRRDVEEWDIQGGQIERWCDGNTGEKSGRGSDRICLRQVSETKCR